MQKITFKGGFGVVLCALAFPVLLSAQVKWSGGLALGPNFTNERIENDVLDSQTKTGYALGLRVACHSGKRLAVQAEALIEQKGSKFQATITDIEGNPIAEGNAKKHFYYLVFPVTVQWRFGSGGFRYGPYAGVYGAKLIQEKFVLPMTEGNFDRDDTDAFRKTDAGAVFGFGAAWVIEEAISFNMEARYSMGLTNYFRDGVFPDHATHQSMALLFGLNFNLGK